MTLTRRIYDFIAVKNGISYKIIVLLFLMNLEANGQYYYQ